jgi:threonine synthase
MRDGWRSYLTFVDCTGCGARFEASRLLTTCEACGKVLFARYDLDALKRALEPDRFAGRRWDLWRYAELLPVRAQEAAVSLGEGMTPLLRMPEVVASGVGLQRGRLLIKDEGSNPTGSFKARGMAVAVSRAKELGAPDVALPSAGNAGSAAAAYAAAAGLTAHIAVPRDTPSVNLAEMRVAGADLILVDGLIDRAGAVIHERAGAEGWFELATLREPYRQEGKKTLGLELAEQGGWGADCLPDVLVFPTGGGTGVVGMWKAFAELEALGWIGSKRPKMVVVQAAGCAPLVRAFERGSEHADPWRDASTIASGLRVPSAIGDYLVMRAIRESGGTALAVSDAEIQAAQVDMAQKTGLYPCPEGAATWAALPRLRDRGFLKGHESVLLFNTGMGIKYEPPPTI